MATVSAVVLTKNEEEMLPLCLGRLSWADEVLVVDSGSTDGTVALAEKAGARVLYHAFENFASQFNWGLANATGDWTFLVDADELVTPELRDSVLATVARGPTEDIFLLRRDSYVFGHLMKASSWSGEWIPRLARRGKMSFTGEVHPDPQVGDGPLGRLRGVLLHYTYRTTEQYFKKFDLYSSLWARKAMERGRRTGLVKASASSLWRFFHNYFIRGEIRDGRVGFALAVLGGMHTFIRHMKLWGLQNAAKFGRVEDRDGRDA